MAADAAPGRVLLLEPRRIQADQADRSDDHDDSMITESAAAAAAAAAAPPGLWPHATESGDRRPGTRLGILSSRLVAAPWQSRYWYTLHTHTHTLSRGGAAPSWRGHNCLVDPNFKLNGEAWLNEIMAH